MQQKHLSEVARLMNIAIKIDYPVEAQWDNFKYNVSGGIDHFKFIIRKAEYERDDSGGDDHIYGFDITGRKYRINSAKVRQYSPDAVPFVWNAQEGCSW
jgi:hypothetical protein